MPRRRDFNPDVLHHPIYAETIRLTYATGKGIQGDGWQFNIFLPRRILLGATKQLVCNARDERLLGHLLIEHFGGYSFKVDLLAGFGLRKGKTETNLHRVFTVIASRTDNTSRYFQLLRKELQECSGEEQIFIVKQDIRIV